ncbi:MAG: PIN/TRAM domain-containing protein [Bacillota bacterium]
MVLHVLRALFILLMAAAGWHYLLYPAKAQNEYNYLAFFITLCIGVFFLCVDILSPRKKLVIFSGTFFGLLVGMIMTYALSYIVLFVVDVFLPKIDPTGSAQAFAQASNRNALINFVDLIIGIVVCYLAISFVLQTKDDFRFIIPYVEFNKQIRGARPILVDTSVIIDGRILDLAETGIIESRLIVPRFVVEELQTIADMGDKLKRNRGRRGLDILTKLQSNKKVEVAIYEWGGHHAHGQEAEGADQKLLVLAKELNARVLTNDANLGKVAQVRAVDIVNINQVASALRPVVLPGERMVVRLIKPGEEPSQGIGFLEDGTMVVVKDGRNYINEEAEFVVTNVLQTATGRMIFGQMAEGTPSRRPRPKQTT